LIDAGSARFSAQNHGWRTTRAAAARRFNLLFTMTAHSLANISESVLRP
jgi:hypothetical protein